MSMEMGMTNEQFAKIVHHGRGSKLIAAVVAVYDHPKDYPQSYVARVHIVGRGRHWPSPSTFIVRDTLEEVRAAIPAGMHRLNRSPTDDPCIVETYL